MLGTPFCAAGVLSAAHGWGLGSFKVGGGGPAALASNPAPNHLPPLQVVSVALFAKTSDGAPASEPSPTRFDSPPTWSAPCKPRVVLTAARLRAGSRTYLVWTSPSHAHPRSSAATATAGVALSDRDQRRQRRQQGLGRPRLQQRQHLVRRCQRRRRQRLRARQRQREAPFGGRPLRRERESPRRRRERHRLGRRRRGGALHRQRA